MSVKAAFVLCARQREKTSNGRAGVQKYLDALQMGIDALMKIEEDTRK